MTSDCIDLKSSVLSILRRHEGKEMAITGAEMASMHGQKDDRLIRLAIRGLISEGHPVLSSTTPPYGYYLAKDRSEVEAYLGKLHHRAMEDLGRYHDLKMGSGYYFDGTRQGSLL